MLVLVHALFYPRIQMNVDADDHGKEGIAFSGVDAHLVEMVIIEHTVVHPFAGSSVIVDSLVFLCAPWNGSVKPDVPVGFGVDAAAIRRRGAFRPAWAGVRFAADKRAAPFTGMLLFAVSPVDHTEPGPTQRCAVPVDPDGVRDRVRPSPVGVEINEGADAPFLAKAVSSVVVMGGVQAEVTDGDVRVNGSELAEGDDGADAVMPPGI